jgi:hypothetical protein
VNQVVFFIILPIFWVTHPAFAQLPTGAPRLPDPNVRTSTVASDVTRAAPGTQIAEQIVRQAVVTNALSPDNLCAVVIVPGAANSFDIRFGVFNVAADRLDVLIIDSFRAFGGQSLLHQSVFDIAAPGSGTLNVSYPTDETGRGPVVLSFMNFTQFTSASFSTDPDTYDDPDFGATVRNLDKTAVEAVYSNGQRCRGTLKFKSALNASVANLLQVFPEDSP